jgi:hypothetical protein
MSSSMPAGRRAFALLVVPIFFVLVLGTLLVGCGPEDRGGANAPGLTTGTQAPRTTTARPVEETTTQPVEETSQTRPPNVAEATAAGVDEALIREHLSRLTGASPAPLPRGPVIIAERGSVYGRRMAAEYMERSFEGMSIPARILRFSSSTGRGFNVEATLQGTEDGKHLWVTAHLDSVYNSGANDDASGLVLLLLVAKALERLDLKHTVHFVAYDLEEVGLVGSSVYVENTVRPIRRQEGDQAIIGDIHNDMVGYEADEFNAFVGTCNRAGTIDDAIMRASQMLDNPIALNEVCLGRSDHRHFWDAGLPAVVLTDGTKYDYYPWYHAPGDTVDKLNVTYLRSMIRLVATTAALLAEDGEG